MLILQRNVFSGIVDQAHTTVGMVATVIMAASTTIRIPVADTVEATHGMAETEIMEVYPTTNMDKGALFNWDVSIMIVVSSSVFNSSRKPSSLCQHFSLNRVLCQVCVKSFNFW